MQGSEKSFVKTLHLFSILWGLKIDQCYYYYFYYYYYYYNYYFFFGGGGVGCKILAGIFD